MEIISFYSLILPLLSAVIAIGAGFLIRRILFSYLHKLTGKTASEWDDIIVSSLWNAFILWWLAGYVFIVLKLSDLAPNIVHIGTNMLLVLIIVSVTLVLSTLTTKLIDYYARVNAAGFQTTSLSENVARGIIFGCGVLIILHTLGISIAPMLTALGVGGLAVALALQDTLANLFAGFYITISQQVKIGDYVQLETKEEGYVADMNWRATKIRSLPNNMIIVPNQKLASSIVLNYHQPSKELAVLVQMGVDYTSDLDKVERVTVEAAKEIMQTITGGVPDNMPFIRYHTFGDSSIGFTVILRGKEFVDQYLIKHEFIKLIHKRYLEEGITIPFPIRTLHLNINKNEEDKSI